MKVKLFSIWLVLFLGCTERSTYTIPVQYREIQFEEKTGMYDKKNIIVRINTVLEPIIGSGYLTYQSAVSVVIKHPLDNGLPDSTEMQSLNDFEKSLIQQLVNPGYAVYALEVLSDKTCEFIFYTGQPETVEKTFRKLSEVTTDQKFSFSVKQDKKWINYTWFASWK